MASTRGWPARSPRLPRSTSTAVTGWPASANRRVWRPPPQARSSTGAPSGTIEAKRTTHAEGPEAPLKAPGKGGEPRCTGASPSAEGEEEAEVAGLVAPEVAQLQARRLQLPLDPLPAKLGRDLGAHLLAVGE